MNDTPRIAEVVKERARDAVTRAWAGVRLVARRRARRRRLSGPAIESPSFVLAVGLVTALAAIKLLDPILRAHPGITDGSFADRVLTALTSFGEGVEIMVGAGVTAIVIAALDPAGLTRRVRHGLVQTAGLAVFAFVSVAGSGLVTALIKNLYGRARPTNLLGESVFQLHASAFTSKFAAFPSGHATTAGASAVVLALIFPRFKGTILAFGAVVALTRIMLAAHFPSDVAAGFAIGAAFTLATARLLARRGVVFETDAEGALRVRAAARPAAWFDHLAAVIAAAKR